MSDSFCSIFKISFGFEKMKNVHSETKPLLLFHSFFCCHSNLFIAKNVKNANFFVL